MRIHNGKLLRRSKNFLSYILVMRCLQIWIMRNGLNCGNNRMQTEDLDIIIWMIPR